MVAPVLVESMLLARRGSRAAQTVWLGARVLALQLRVLRVRAAFNDIFVLHIALFSLSIAAVVLTIGSIDVDAIGSPIPRRERSEGQTVGLFHANADVPGVKLFPLEGVVLASGFAVATFALLLPHRKR